MLITGGSFTTGTEPGRFERRPALEPRPSRIALGHFEIDASPHPGGGPALLGLPREQAIERCAERGGRLCTELEWERACKGPDSAPFPSGTSLAPACVRPPGCPSGFGVWGLGSLREWTASDVPGRGRAVLRGAPPGADPDRRRCAHREEAGPTSRLEDVGFRCCYGPPNAARVVMPKLGAAFAQVTVTPAQLGTWLEADPNTRALALDLQPFDPKTAVESALVGARRARGGATLTTSAIAWNPAPGVDLLVVAARSGASTAFVVAFDVLRDGSRRLASSFIMEDEARPVVLAYDPANRRRLEFGTCWRCPGQMGRITYDDPDSIAILQP